MVRKLGVARIVGLLLVALMGILTVVMTTSGLHVTRGDGYGFKTTVVKLDAVPGVLLMAIETAAAWAILRTVQ